MAERKPLPKTYDREALAAYAHELHTRGFNCAQAVACTLAPLLGAEEDETFRLAEGLGGGLATHTETCGALLGGAMVLGMARSNGCADPTSKLATYELVKKIVASFQETFGTSVCSEIRDQDPCTTNPKPICERCIKEALLQTIDVLEELAAERD